MRQKLYFIVISGMTTRYNRASEADVHGQVIFETMIQSPNHQGTPLGSWMNRFRYDLKRWEKKVQNYEAMLHFACSIIIWNIILLE